MITILYVFLVYYFTQDIPKMDLVAMIVYLSQRGSSKRLFDCRKLVQKFVCENLFWKKTQMMLLNWCATPSIKCIWTGVASLIEQEEELEVRANGSWKEPSWMNWRRWIKRSSRKMTSIGSQHAWTCHWMSSGQWWKSYDSVISPS